MPAGDLPDTNQLEQSVHKWQYPLASSVFWKPNTGTQLEISANHLLFGSSMGYFQLFGGGGRKEIFLYLRKIYRQPTVKF